LQDIEFTITLNTKGLAPAIDEFQKTAADNLTDAIQQLQTQIDANPLAFDALTDDQKQALILNQFKSFVGQIDQAWAAGGVSIDDVRRMVLEVSEDYGDTVLPIMSLSKDGIHPTGKGYKQLAEEFK